MAPYRQQRNYHSAEFIFLTFVFINFWPTKLMKYLDKLNLICWIDIDSRQFFPLPSYLKKTFLLQKRSKVILKINFLATITKVQNGSLLHALD